MHGTSARMILNYQLRKHVAVDARLFSLPIRVLAIQDGRMRRRPPHVMPLLLINC